MDLPNTIDTKRLILRPFNRDDFEFFTKIIKDDLVSENLKYLINNKDMDRLEFLFQSIIHSIKTLDPIFALIIIKKDTGDFIGFCGLILLTDCNEAKCFYSLLPRYRGFGFAIEAMKKLIKYGFLKLKLSKLSTFISPESSAIWKVAERVGMKYLGHVQINEIQSKAMYFSIEKNDFDAQQIM